jgi:outer membrane beta-barrel protein
MSLLKILSVLMFLNFFYLEAHGAEDNTYEFSWLDQDKEIFVLQNRKFRKKDRVYLMGGLGMTTSGSFVDSTNFQGRAGYFFKEEWGFELVYNKSSGKENSTAKSVRSSGTGSTPFRRIIQNYMGGMILWSPFYGKLNTFNMVLYYDWFIGLGLATVDEENNRKELDTNGLDKSQTAESHSGLMWCTAWKFWITQNWSARLDLTAIHYKAQTALKNTTKDNETTYSNFDLSAGIEYNF